MRPRNKFEKAVLAESRHLRPISKYGHENEMYKEPMNLKRGKGVYMSELRECGGRTEDKTKCAKG